MKRSSIAAFCMAVFATQGAAATCEKVNFRDARYTVCKIEPAKDQLELFLRDAEGDIYGQFTTIDRMLAEKGQTLVVAMNAGMYHDDRSPVGHYLEDGVEQMRVIPNAGPGNFGLLPNGVLCLRSGRADVFETKDYIARQPDCTDATQSGPMLVIAKELHPRLLPDGTSTFIRNGVGTSADGQTAYFAISDQPVNFYNFAVLFRDYLKVPNALYFDGNISRLFAPQIGRRDFGFALGPIIGVVDDAAD